MHSSTIIAGLALLATQVMAIAVAPLDTRSTQAAHHHVHLPVDDYENWLDEVATGNVTKRTQVQVCQYLDKPGSGTDAYTTEQGLVPALALAAQLAYAGERVADCAEKYATSNAIGIAYYALSNRCGGQALQKTIQGALDKWANKDHDWSTRGVWCLKLTHGGTWSGRIILATKGFDVHDFHCSETVDYNNCVSGGETNA